MLLKITLVIAACAQMKYGDVQKKLAEVQTRNPGATIALRLDKKAQCSNGLVLTGKEAKLFSELHQ